MSAVLAAVLPLVTSIALALMVSADEGAYARLLAAHVRPGVVNGIRLALVDYAAVKGDPASPPALAALAHARPERLGSEAERLAFWINAYNLLATGAVMRGERGRGRAQASPYQVALLRSASACSSQNRMSISRNIRAAPASSSRAR